MKKFLPVFLLFLCIFIFGCPQATDSQTTTKETPPSSSTENTVAELRNENRWANKPTKKTWRSTQD